MHVRFRRAHRTGPDRLVRGIDRGPARAPGRTTTRAQCAPPPAAICPHGTSDSTCTLRLEPRIVTGYTRNGIGKIVSLKVVETEAFDEFIMQHRCGLLSSEPCAPLVGDFFIFL